MSRLLSGILLTTILPLAALFGCDSESGPTGPDFSFGADSATLTQLALASSTMMVNEFRTLDDQYPSFGGFGRYSSADPLLPWRGVKCIPVLTGFDSTGRPIDTDHDGIPDDATIDHGPNCPWVDSAGMTGGILAGSLRFQDTGLGIRSYTVTASKGLNRVEYLASRTWSESAADGVESAIYTDSGASRTVHLLTIESWGDPSTGHSMSLEVTKSVSYDPDPGQHLAPLTPLPVGLFRFDADYRDIGSESGDPGAANYHLILSTPTPLHFDRACAGIGFDSGVFQGVFSANSSIGFRYTWSGCNPPTFEIFGDDLVPEVSASRQ